jgi:hypothetical protein
MNYRNKRENIIKSEIKEACYSGDCEGTCRQLYYNICPIKQKYYIETYKLKSKIKTKKVYIFEEEIRK